MRAADDAQAELFAYTLARGGPAFVHQHAVDALCAQQADARTTPMQLTFALVGLCLHVERGYTGRQVQRVHAALAQRKPSTWPAFVLPLSRGAVRAADVVEAPAGPARDAAISTWCAEIWTTYRDCQGVVLDFLRAHDI